MKKNSTKKFFATLLSAAMILTSTGVSMIDGAKADAAGKAVLKQAKKTVSIRQGKKTTLKIKKKNIKKVRKIIWTSKNKKIATVSKKGVVKAIKAGKTTITAKVNYKAKGAKRFTNKKLKFTVKVTAKKAAATKEPAVSKTPAATASPAPAATAVPSQTPAQPTSKNGIAMYDSGKMDANLTATELMKKMGQGWNLGNTLEACGSAKETQGFTPEDFETFWQKVPTTQTTMDGIHSYGINSVRIPTAWSNMMSDDGKYTINDAYFNRVETVMNYAFKNDMYVILNIHYDSDWWGQFGDKDEAVRQQAWDRFEAFWTQIANRYAEYSEHLVFESANEELGDRLNDDWKKQQTGSLGTGVLTEDECYEVTNKINQKFVDIVRATGGNNVKRQLLIAGYNTDIDKTVDSRFKMPADIDGNGKDKLSVSVHYYSPSTYCIAEDPKNSWGYDADWGTDEQVAALHADFDKMSVFTKEGYGVIIGEYGVCSSSKYGIPNFFKEVATYGKQLGFTPVLWDTGVWYNRKNGLFKFKDVAKIYNDVTGANGEIKDNMKETGPVSAKVIEDESTLTKVASWEGIWTRTDGKKGAFETTATEGDITVETNSAYWQMFLTYDWSKLTNPAIRFTFGTDKTSQKADTLQIGYTTKVDGGADLTNFSGVIGKCIALYPSDLEENPYLEISTTTPLASITKVEIFDAK